MKRRVLAANEDADPKRSITRRLVVEPVGWTPFRLRMLPWPEAMKPGKRAETTADKEAGSCRQSRGAARKARWALGLSTIRTRRPPARHTACTMTHLPHGGGFPKPRNVFMRWVPEVDLFFGCRVDFASRPGAWGGF